MIFDPIKCSPSGPKGFQMVFKVSQKVIDILERTGLNVFACELPSKSWRYHSDVFGLMACTHLDRLRMSWDCIVFPRNHLD